MTEQGLPEEQERDRMMQRGSSPRRGGNEAGATNHIRRQFFEMGLPSRCATSNNVVMKYRRGYFQIGTGSVKRTEVLKRTTTAKPR
jgi:hypothetical protein